MPSLFAVINVRVVYTAHVCSNRQWHSSTAGSNTTRKTTMGSPGHRSGATHSRSISERTHIHVSGLHSSYMHVHGKCIRTQKQRLEPRINNVDCFDGAKPRNKWKRLACYDVGFEKLNQTHRDLFWLFICMMLLRKCLEERIYFLFRRENSP